MTNRRFNLDKFRVFMTRLTVKSTAGHSRITWAERQTYRQDNPEFGVLHLAYKPIKRVRIAMFIEQEAPK